MNNTYINIEIKLYPRNENKEKEINSLKTFSEKYDAIINYYRNIEIDKNVYCENHHINPKSISNDDSVENIVRVPGVIHYILHCLLPFKYKEENNEIGYFKMMNAWSRISNSSIKKKNLFNIYDEGLKYHQFREEYSKYISEYRIKYGLAKGEKNPRYGKEVSKETREKISQANTGKHNTKEQKEKHSKRMSGSGNPMFGKCGNNNVLYKTIWYNNGVISKRFKIGEYPQGWKQGRLNLGERYKGDGNPAFGRKWVYNPTTKERKYIKKNEVDFYLANGFILKFVRDK